jgi:hypothetical protein
MKVFNQLTEVYLLIYYVSANTLNQNYSTFQLSYFSLKWHSNSIQLFAYKLPSYIFFDPSFQSHKVKQKHFCSFYDP